mgnify:CR=1 FL=1
MDIDGWLAIHQPSALSSSEALNSQLNGRRKRPPTPFSTMKLLRKLLFSEPLPVDIMRLNYPFNLALKHPGSPIFFDNIKRSLNGLSKGCNILTAS